MNLIQDLMKVLLVLLLSGAAHAQSFHMGRCPKPPVQQDFDIAKYMGIWYEIEKLPARFELGKCVQATYTLLSDGTVRVHNAELLSNGKVNSIEGVATVEHPSQPAILDVSFVKGLPHSAYWVLSTDYHTYAVVYSCFDYLGLFHVDFAWILGRARTLPGDVISRQRDLLASGAAVDLNRLSVSNQTGCDAMA